jgi:uncharacterized lipoprotein YbaY
VEKVAITGTIELDRRRTLDGAVAEVRLLDTAMADAPARIVAGSPVICAQGHVDRIPFRIEAMVAEDRDYALVAEIRLHGGTALEPGDLLTVVRTPWRNRGDAPVTLPVSEVL